MSDSITSSAGFLSPQGRAAAAQTWTGNTDLIDHFPRSAPRANVEVLATYTLQVLGPNTGGVSYHENQARWLLPHIIHEAEENLTDLLPEGYSVQIKEWSND